MKTDTALFDFNTFSIKQKKTIAYWGKKQPDILILEGAVRSGKTFINNILFLLLVALHENENKQFILSGVTRTSLTRNVLVDIWNIANLDLIKLPQDGIFQLWGNTINCFGADSINTATRVRGMTAQGWYANEVTKQNPAFVNEALSRCSEPNSKILFDCNPDNPLHHIYQNYILKSGIKNSNGHEIIKSIHYVMRDNPTITDDYIDRLTAGIPIESANYQRNVLGKWVVSGNAIYTKQKVKDFVVDINDYDYLVAGMDFGHGGINESAFVLFGKIKNKYFALAEVKAVFETNGDFVNAVQKCLDDIVLDAIKKNTQIYADSEAPGLINEFARAGFRICAVKKGKGSVVRGIELVQRIDLTIHKTKCIQLQHELLNYEWKVDRNGNVLNEPRKENDHLADATRYAVFSTYTHSNIDVENQRLIHARPRKKAW